MSLNPNSPYAIKLRERQKRLLELLRMFLIDGIANHFMDYLTHGPETKVFKANKCK